MLALIRALRCAIYAEEHSAITATYIDLAARIGREKAMALAYRFWRTRLRRS